jgi:hypothetical protein
VSCKLEPMSQDIVYFIPSFFKNGIYLVSVYRGNSGSLLNILKQVRGKQSKNLHNTSRYFILHVIILCFTLVSCAVNCILI